MPTPSASFSTKKSARLCVVARPVAAIALPLGRRGDLVGLDQRHRMDADMFADDEFHAREADAVVGQHRRLEGQIRIAEIDHDRGARLREFVQRPSLRDLDRQSPRIDVAGLAFGAGNRHLRAGLQLSCRVGRTDNGRNAEFAGDNGGMTGASAAIGDDGGGDLHDRLPVRAGRLRDQNVARP